MNILTIIVFILISSCSIVQPSNYKINGCLEACKENKNSNIVVSSYDDIIYKCECCDGE